jgi:succinate dehydrogenase / fumarate reductase flavoprotein subunit
LKNKVIDRVYETDVLAVGGGGAGITAAIAARRSGARVTLVSKGKIGNSGNTIMIGGSFAMDGESAYHKYGLTEADPSYTKEVLFNGIVKDGFYLNDQNIVEQFVEESPEIVNEVRLWGERAGQTFLFGKPATWVMSGRGMGRALLQGLNETEGIERVEDVIIVELLKEGDKVTGAMGIDIYSGDIIQFNAKAVVLGTGGFQPMSLKNTNSDMTGDGVAMAFRAGAKLADMEFLLFLITALEPNEIKGSILPIMALISPKFKYVARDKDGNEIVVPPRMKEIEAKSELCKLIHLYYYGKAVAEGRGTEDQGVYFDLSQNTDAEIEQMFDGLIDFMAKLYKRGYYHGDNIMEYKELALRSKRLKIGMGNEYTVGGIVVNESMETSVPGLFAGGECTSGCFGANRVADAVVEMLVQGYRAGLSAAGYAAGSDATQSDAAAAQIAEQLLALFDNEGGISAATANLTIESISDKGLSFFRSEEGLNTAIQAYEQLEQELANVTLKSKSRAYNFEWIQAIQAGNRLLCAKVAAMMARERKESRGLHLRLDYPDVDNDNFLVRIIADNVNGEIALTSRKPIATRVPLPAGGKTEFIQFMLDNDMGLENVQH